jgi:uncharacterized protein
LPRIHVRCYEELNEYLPPGRRKLRFEQAVAQGATVAGLLEMLGIPAQEVDLVLVDDESVGLGHRLYDGARVSVYPVFESFDIAPLARVGREPRRRLRFVADVHLGRLAGCLRMAGFDTLYRSDYTHGELVALASRVGRVLLTCDRALAGNRDLTRVYLVRAARAREQLAEVLERFDLYRLARPLTRCPRCNHPLAAVDRAVAAGHQPAAKAERDEGYWQCTGCDRLYREGPHVQRMRGILAALRPPFESAAE